MPDFLLYAYAALIGAAIGSFLNVCILRLPEGESVVSPPSRCPSCGTRLAWYDNVPVLGWAWLRGKCRTCRTPISPLYPLVELATALLWVAAAVRYGLSWQALSAAVFFTLLLGIAMTDARKYIIPDEFSLGGLAAGLALAFAPGGITPQNSVMGAVLGYGLLWLVGTVGEWMFRKPAMGGGDVKM
ncbi:MAG TPA: prepilin peptidase, partial [Longimicrobiaceae bacterium]